MNFKSIRKTAILVILFFLPVVFLLFLYPSKHNYNTLEIIKGDILETSAFTTEDGETIGLENNLTVLGFFGSNPMDKATAALNLKELIYDKFKGFKRFQILILVPNGSEAQVKLLKQELLKYDVLKYWHFAYGDQQEIVNVFNSLKTREGLDKNFGTDHVFIIDKERNQRGRLDDRTEREIEKEKPVYGLSSYDCIEVSEIKNKMSEDMRILFTEYRQKRKGTFDSSTRRAEDLKPQDDEQN
ncbi:MAG: hypothetical protein GXO84_00755 [Chlorobi bacterium]|nr:hypothetical protein [Chlorobiota bacterium]